jgi:hypothetical protein
VPDEQALSEWRANAIRSGATAGPHPVLAYDNLDNGGYRLASLIEVDVADLDRHQLAGSYWLVSATSKARLLQSVRGRAATADGQLGIAS